MDDPTELNATERDVLSAVALAMDGRPPTSAEVRSIAAETSARVSRESNGTFYQALDSLVERSLVEKDVHPGDARKKRLGLTVDGEEALAELAERSDEARMGEEP